MLCQLASERTPVFRILGRDEDCPRRTPPAQYLRPAADDDGDLCGAIAVDLFRKGPPFDLILMDLQMPVMDGIAATVQIRQLEAEADLPRTPIVALTANAMRGDRDRCLQVGMDDFISKPVRKQNLRAVLARLQPASQQAPQDARLEASDSDHPSVLDPASLQRLRELETSAEFNVTEFVELFQNSAPACLQRGRQAYNAGDSQSLLREVHV